jgi:hypothetical protein
MLGALGYTVARTMAKAPAVSVSGSPSVHVGSTVNESPVIMAPAKLDAVPTRVIQSPSGPTAAMLAVLLLGLCTAPTGCVGTQSQRNTTLTAAHATIDVAAKLVASYDARDTAVELAAAKAAAAAPTLEQGKEMIAAGRARRAAYVAKRNKVEATIDVAYEAYAAAVKINDDHSLAGLTAAAANVAAALSDLIGAKP